MFSCILEYLPKSIKRELPLEFIVIPYGVRMSVSLSSRCAGESIVYNTAVLIVQVMRFMERYVTCISYFNGYYYIFK